MHFNVKLPSFRWISGAIRIAFRFTFQVDLY